MCAMRATVLAFVFALLPDGNCQSTRSTNEREEPTTRPRVVLTSRSADASRAYVLASTHNTRLVFNLEWTFGGRQQRGWYLYVPLIQQLINAEHEAGTSEFAAALARWQESVGLDPTGVLNVETIGQMIETWQARRSPDRTAPSPAQLITAPISDFYDPTRLAELRQVEQQTYAAYRRMVAAAAADPSSGLNVTATGELASSEKSLRIISSFRTREYQEHLRRMSPNSGRAGLAVNSPHFTGRALDLYVGGEPVDTADRNRAIQIRTPIYLWLVKNAGRFGFHPYFYEPWHWEYRPQE